MTGGAGAPVLAAPDKLKGTLDADEAARAIARGLAAGGLEAVETCPVADGGEGTMDVLLSALGGERRVAEVADPLGRPVTADWALLAGGKRAVVEMAQASGLWRVAEDERDAWAASTRGTGELIDSALECGVREVIVAVGGSATTDGGRGALETLGARFGRDGVELDELRRRLRDARLVVVCDVRSPLLGPAGSARTFGPQKGAGPALVKRLERRLAGLAEQARAATGRDPGPEPMAGAAGGLAGGLWAFAGAELRPGAAYVLDALGFGERLERVRAVVTGEGCLDRQTLEGKALAEVAVRARQVGLPCFAVVGRDDLDAFGHRQLDLAAVEEAPSTAKTAAAAVERAAQRLAPAIAGRAPSKS